MNIEEEASKLIAGIKRDEYGPIVDSFKNIAKIWSGILDTPVSDIEVALCMIGLKIYRESRKHKRDNLVDIIGYTKCLKELRNVK